MNKSVTLILALIVLVGLFGSPCLAYMAPGTTETAYLVWTDEPDSPIIATDQWMDIATTFDWTVSRPTDPLAPLTYTYVFTVPTTPGTSSLSHFDLQVSAQGELSEFSFLNLLDFPDRDDYPDGTLEMVYYDSGQTGDWMVDGDVALRFESELFEDGSSWTIEFQSYRLPMEGQWYAKGGQDDSAYNNTIYGVTLVPNDMYVPVPGAVLLGILGMGVAGIKLRKFA